MKFNITLSRRLLVLLFAFLIGYFFVALISTFLVMKWGTTSTPAMRILTVMQDVFMFIAPAILAAVISTRQPAELLAIDRRINWPVLIVGVCTMICAMPAMNMVIWLNQQMPLPDSIEQTVKGMEENAAAMVEALQGPRTVGNLIMAILIVGFFAGVSEELLFRGAFQRIMSTGGLNIHASIWIAACVFSLMHMQFYGFVPRMLLGAFFGYALWWSRCLWVPIILHAMNNIVYICSQWNTPIDETSAIDSFGAGSDYAFVAISVVLTAFGLWQMRRRGIAPRSAS